MRKIGLALSGGGGKGPYEIGVWKYLNEIGLDKAIGAVSGTSVGALNAAFFASNDVNYIEKMWRQIKPGDILSQPKFTDENIADWLKAAMGVVASPFLDPLGILGVASILGLAKTLTASLNEHGSVMSQEGMKNKILQGVDFNKLRNSPIPCYATCLALSLPPKAKRFDITKLSPKDATTVLMASSAIPGVFEAVEYKGQKYFDGGFTNFGDNLPVEPLYKTGFKTIIAVHLDCEEPVDKTLYPGTKIIDIIPQENLGGIIKGTMDFTSEGANYRIDLGYKEAKEQLEPHLDRLLSIARS